MQYFSLFLFNILLYFVLQFRMLLALILSGLCVTMLVLTAMQPGMDEQGSPTRRVLARVAMENLATVVGLRGEYIFVYHLH